jgi:preprotein translocase subunit SecY
MLVGLLLIVGVVFVEQGQRRIPVQYAKRRSAAAPTAARPPTSR